MGMDLKVPSEKVTYITELAKLNVDTLRILADLSKKPGIEKKLKEKLPMIKMFL